MSTLSFAQAIDGSNLDIVYEALSNGTFYGNLSNLAVVGKRRLNALRPNVTLPGFDNDRINYAISVVEKRTAAEPEGVGPAAEDKTAAASWLADLVSKPLYVFTEDVTGFCPAPNPSASRLSMADFDRAAAELGIEAAAIHAVAEVECGGRTGFDNRGNPKILFEAHQFRKFTGGAYDATHPHLSRPFSTSPEFRRYYAWDQWSRMYEAMDLDLEAAWKSASWGMFQVMGFNHNGWAGVRDFASNMFVSEYQQLRAFMAYCKDNGLMKYMNAKDWGSFATAYNGAGFGANQYDTKMAAAYAKYAK
jgi:hypothetical protein